MSGSPRVALLVDHPQRDLPGLTRIARELALRGAEAFLVPFNLQRQELAALAPDFVLSNYLRKNNQASVREYLADGIGIGVSPTEGGVFATLPDEVWSSTITTARGTPVDPRWRFYALTMADDAEARRGVRCYCAWSAGFKEYAAEAGWYAAEQTAVCGVPRLDFYAPQWRAAALARAPYVAAYRQPLVLINGGFPLVNPRFQTPEQEGRQMVERFGFHPDFVRKMCADAQRALSETVELASLLAQRFPDVTFVYRPHPFEDPELYARLLEPRENLRLETRGTVDEWLVRASALIHWRSSTAIEAGLLDVPAFQAAWLCDDPPRPMVDSVSHGMQSPDALAEALGAALRGELPTSEKLAADRARIASEVYGPCDGRACERVADAVMRSLETASPAPTWRLCERIASQLDASSAWRDALAKWDAGDKAFGPADVRQIHAAIAAAAGDSGEAIELESGAPVYRFRCAQGRSIRIAQRAAARVPARASARPAAGDTAGTWLERAQRSYEGGALDEAAELCERALRAAPDSAGAWALAARLSQAAGQEETAEVAWRRVLSLRPGDVEALEALAKRRPIPVSPPAPRAAGMAPTRALPQIPAASAARPRSWREWLADPRWFEAPVHCRGSVRANTLGLQPARQLLHRVEFGRFFRARSHPERALARDGIVAIPDFFPERVFAEIQSAWHEVAASPRAVLTRDRAGTGVDWTSGPIGGDGPGRCIVDAFARDPRVLDLARFVIRLPERGIPALILQQLALPRERRDDVDRETALHVDRHYPCVKVCFYINANEAANGAFVYCPGSHRLTWQRMAYEYVYGIQHQRWKAGLEVCHPWVEMERGRPVASRAARELLGLREVQYAFPPNTLVLSNNMGFHRRGQMQPGQVRQQIRILFYQELVPWMGRLLTRLRGAR
jgi:surface carbohydrate biosynthesis protein